MDRWLEEWMNEVMNEMQRRDGTFRCIARKEEY